MNRHHEGRKGVGNRVSWQMALAMCMVAASIILAGVSHAEDLDRLMPKQMPESGGDEGSVRPVPVPQAPPDKGETVLTGNLAGLVFVNSPDKIIKKGLAQKGIIVDGYQEQEFFGQMGTYLGKPLTLNGLNEILKKVVLYFRSTDRPVVDVYVPEQDISSGTVQVVIVEGNLGTVRTEGNKWFKDSLLIDSIRTRHGEVIHGRPLLEDLNWVNQNPFRRSDIVFTRGTNPGETDIVLKTQDRFPVRVFAGYEDSGTELTGKDRLLAGFNWGNAFGIDHQLNYQYTADKDFDKFQAHSVSYLAPLPWRHMLSLAGSFSKSKPDVEDFDMDGKSTEFMGRYTIPLQDYTRYTHFFQAGIDYKDSDNNLQFSEIPVFDKKTQVLQGLAGYTGMLSDNRGATKISGNIFFSPGGLMKYNKDEYFEDMTPGSKAKYVYAQLNVDRMTAIAKGFDWSLRINTQFASCTLLDSEKMGFGGYDTVRGYDERDVNGDGGVLVVNELLTPAIDLKGAVKTGRDLGVLRFLVFVDYGYAANHGTTDNTSLYSTGIGFRYGLGTHVTARFDYGWQLKDIDTEGEDNSRAHVGIVAAF
jgi:hemolysin activation/secretion protein